MPGELTSIPWNTFPSIAVHGSVATKWLRIVCINSSLGNFAGAMLTHHRITHMLAVSHFINMCPTISIQVSNLHDVFTYFDGEFQKAVYWQSKQRSSQGTQRVSPIQHQTAPQQNVRKSHRVLHLTTSRWSSCSYGTRKCPVVVLFCIYTLALC